MNEKPVFRTSNGKERGIIHLVWFLLVIFAIWFWNAFFEHNYEQGTITFNGNLRSILAEPMFYLFLFGFIGAFLIWQVSDVSVNLFKERIELGKGNLFAKLLNIQSRDIKSIDTTTLQANLYFPNIGFKGVVHSNVDGWIAYVCTNKSRGVMIQTDEMNYMFSCPDAEGVAEKMRELYGVGKGNIEPPPLKVKVEQVGE